MVTELKTEPREIVQVEDARIRPMMGINVLESLPLAQIPYEIVDPFILVHEGVVPISPEMAGLDTKHPHRGFDNLWYLIDGAASTGHSTGPGGTMERAKLETGSLLKLRTGRGVWHAEGIGEDELREGKAGSEMRGVLFGDSRADRRAWRGRRDHRRRLGKGAGRRRAHGRPARPDLVLRRPAEGSAHDHPRLEPRSLSRADDRGCKTGPARITIGRRWP